MCLAGAAQFLPFILLGVEYKHHDDTRRPEGQEQGSHAGGTTGRAGGDYTRNLLHRKIEDRAYEDYPIGNCQSALRVDATNSVHAFSANPIHHC